MLHKVKRNVAAMSTHTIENAEVQDYRQRLDGAAKALKAGLEETAATERNWTSLVGSNFVNFADRYVHPPPPPLWCMPKLPYPLCLLSSSSVGLGRLFLLLLLRSHT